MHILPQLRKLERKFSNELVVVGVHSAKFPEERRTQNVREAAQRYRIEHPVVNDAEFQVWQAFAARAWPSLFFIDPQGRVIGKHEGEFPLEPIERLIEEMILDFNQKGLLDRRPLPFHPEPGAGGALAFPGKVLADPATQRLFTADSNHDRIVVTDFEGNVQSVYGGVGIGLRDGDGEQALFNQPQGMALVGNSLYVADTENHAIRRLDLQHRRVETVSGTGEQAKSLGGGGPARQTPLSSPWDLAYFEGRLIIAMAGLHQLWVLHLDGSDVAPVAGAGNEGLRDGPLESAWFAQPSGLSVGDGLLYVADSETSAIRVVDLVAAEVRTLVGGGLFDFGDVDGSGDEVRLQHPLGVAWGAGVLFVADSYNNKIKRLYPVERRVETMPLDFSCADDGSDGPNHLNELGGLAVAGDRLFVADTNNHRICMVDVRTGDLSVLGIRGL